MVLEEFLPEVPENPWKGTNEEHSDFEYILTVDVRGVIHGYLAEVNESTGAIERYIVIEDEEAVIKNAGDELTFTDVWDDINVTPNESNTHLRYFFP